MEGDNERITMDISKRVLAKNTIELVTKLLLALIAFMSIRLMDKVEAIDKANNSMLNSVIEIKIGMQNNQERIYNLERDFKDFQKNYYTNK